jgi:hypothetical protein
MFLGLEAATSPTPMPDSDTRIDAPGRSIAFATAAFRVGTVRTAAHFFISYFECQRLQVLATSFAKRITLFNELRCAIVYATAHALSLLFQSPGQSIRLKQRD